MNSVEDASMSNLSGMMENAVASLRMGIEDYAAPSPERALSAVRNFYAGVLLLGKEVLVRAAPLADPDEVIGARYEPVQDGQGGVQHVMQGQQTIDFHTLGRRFKTFGIAIDTKLLEELNGLRNAIEHRYTNETTDAVREAIARAFCSGKQESAPKTCLSTPGPRCLMYALFTRRNAKAAARRWQESIGCRRPSSKSIWRASSAGPTCSSRQILTIRRNPLWSCAAGAAAKNPTGLTA